MQRIDIFLTKAEEKEFNSLEPKVGQAWSFWEKVAKSRDLDYKTLLTINGRVSALPLNHGKHWCWPYDLICKDPPSKQKIKFYGEDDYENNYEESTTI